MRFINDDASLLHDKRITPYYNSTHGLIMMIMDEAKKNGCSKSNLDGFEFDDNDARKVIKAVMKNPMLAKDNVFGVEIENFVCNYCPGLKVDIGPNLFGPHTFDNGLTFYGFTAGGDDQKSVFMIIYYDGENLRLYTPAWGNKLNINRKEPLSNDTRSKKYMSRYNLSDKTLGFNWNAMKIDILANIQVDYESVQAKHLACIENEKGD